MFDCFWGDFKCFYFTVCFSESTFMLKVVSLGGMTRDRDFSGCSGRGSGARIIDDLPEIIFRIYFGCLSVSELWESLLLGRYF